VSRNSEQEVNQSFPVDFDEITSIVFSEFQIEEGLLEYNVPTYYLMQPQETKEAFLRLLEKLESNNLIATLRRRGKRIVLKIIPKPPIKKSNVLINWILFFATIGTVFVTGYMVSIMQDVINPFIGGILFTIALMAVIGTHEMGHKLTANRRGIEATPPYFIPGPPPIGGLLPIGTFGAVIIQKELPPNRDALYDVGASGPVYGFILSIIVTIIGIRLSPIFFTDEVLPLISAPLIFNLLIRLFFSPPPLPWPAQYMYINVHPVLWAGWIGFLLTAFQLFPAASLDGGHIASSIVNNKVRVVLTGLSILFLIIIGAYPMALLLLFMSTARHPDPLDNVSKVSNTRKAFAIVLIAIFIVSIISF
jgi:membrane-associated protease RseP (regulator of RpoE activity)